ncbi:hypothetical protein CLV28_3041 [Sediminihabitans luteus]|uniref:Uncharacterized protein n=1 Tax=Sediminihabitans luteus TaxID=1138585 RepID=A0A2M9CC47_9CELL|nr:GNAT family N-acetyltransferase [Sediminihabitans luteus]PJJ68625.1 hypothetical protein CLV28_3041 [Sediminihabitans luteus]GII99965.1 N-acetyltransferase [Sediminihabitans luteus]
MTTPLQYDVVHRPGHERYEARTPDGEVVGTLEYVRREDGLVEMPHTVVPPEHGGQGIAGALARRALDDARAEGLRVVPTCWYVDGWIARHPDYQDLVAR